ncbi:hypothetical protein ACIF8T_12130 [Streptomyces sp. NPDC085946]|uniref:hypothetical protein n=1 Tax=Streptomyces sp. NPDC085946 TaxID=3365744 RepID=UPI0037CFCCE3
MNLARQLALVDEPGLRPFPAEHGPADVGVSGPGCHGAVLRSDPAPGDGGPARWTVTAGRFEKDRDALSELPASRCGDATRTPCGPPGRAPGGRRHPSRGPGRARARAARLRAPVGTGRRVAVAGRDAVRLPAVVTETDPP